MGDPSGARLDRLAWGLSGLAVTAVVAYVVYAFVGGILVGVFLYYATRPVRDWLRGYLDHPDVNAAVALLAVGVPLLLVVGYGAVVAFRELNQFLQVYQLSAYRSLAEPYVDLPLLSDPESVLGFLRENAGRILPFVRGLFRWGGRVFVAVVVAFFLLRDDAKVASWFRESVGRDHDAVRYFEGVDEDLVTVYTGNLLTIAFTAVIAAVTFYAFDLVAPGSPTIRFPVLLGLLVGAFTLVPVVGMKAIWVPYAGYLFVRSVWWNQMPVWVPVAFAAVTFVVVDTVPDFFVRSYLSKGDVNMGLMILAYTLGVIVFGWYGLFLGPLVLVLFLHVARRVFPNVVDLGAVRFVDD